jgi:CBS-domain-containing membrane protein
MLFAEDTIWHFWIAVPLALAAILVVLGIVALYFYKVTRTRYPRERA